MYNNITVPKTSKWARLFKRFATIEKIDIPDSINELASQYDFGVNEMCSFTSINRYDKEFIQNVLDMEFRTIHITSSLEYTKILQNLLYAAIEGNAHNIVIVANTNLQSLIQNTIEHFFPNDEVCLVSNKFNPSSYVNLPTRKWFITPNAKFCSPVIPGEPIIFDHMIYFKTDLNLFGRFSDDDTFLQGFTKEITRSSFVLVYDKPVNMSEYSLYIPLTFIINNNIFDRRSIVIENINANHTTNRPLYHNKNKISDIIVYLKRKGLSVSIRDLLELSGVFFDPYYYPKDNSLNLDISTNYFISKNKKESYLRYISNQEKILNGISLIDFVKAELAKESPDFSPLKNQFYYKTKNAFLYRSILPKIAEKKRMLIVSKDYFLLEFINSISNKVILDNNIGNVSWGDRLITTTDDYTSVSSNILNETQIVMKIDNFTSKDEMDKFYKFFNKNDVDIKIPILEGTFESAITSLLL